MNKLLEFLNTKIDEHRSNSDKWKLIGFVSAFVFIFLIIFQPFGVNNFDPTYSIDLVFFLSMLGFGLLQGLVLALCEFVIFPALLVTNTILRLIFKIVLELVFLATFTFLYYNILGNFHDWKLTSYFEFIFNISVMGIIPFSIVILFLNYKKTKQAYRTLELQPKVQLSDVHITLSSHNDKEEVILLLSNLRYIEAQDNYILVYFVDNKVLKKHLLRSTLKGIEKSIQNKSLMRCHRSYIVNIDMVEKVNRFGHQMELYLPDVTHPIPVSRTYISKIKLFLDTRHT